MGIIVILFSLTVLGFLYRRMIARDVPEPIGRRQALLPLLLGFVAVPLSLVFTYTLEAFMEADGSVASDDSLIAQSLKSAFFDAGLTEELAKFLMILVALRIFRNTARNVYEYMLIGAGVGFGFTLPEEFIYLFDMSGLFFRAILIAGHLVYGVVMTYFLGMAKYRKVTNQGTPIKEYLLTFLLPILMHTLYDACTGCNAFLDHEDEDIQLIGVGIGLVGMLAMFVVQIRILLKCKNNAEKLCALRLLPETPPQVFVNAPWKN